ncbi:regulator [Streptomyces sp. NPDC019890]|uniref:regulator n=1 Tax=Streptomyces sp. NPDC019890 TaxID=3365064 RepID=UPI003850DC60
MNCADTLTAAQVDRAIAVLAHPGLIRLVSEIDDNGPFPRRTLARTLADLARHQVRHALVAGRDHGLVKAGQHAGNPSYLLTEAGAELADVYDTAARWARAHHYPAIDSDFVTRVQATLALLCQEPVLDALPDTNDAMATAVQEAVDADLLPTTDAALGLRRPWAALSVWIRTNPSVLPSAGDRPASTATADAEFAA